MKQTNKVKDFNKAIAINPRDAEAYKNRGNAKYELKQFEEAIKDYDEAIKINPQFGFAHYNRGNAKLYIKRSSIRWHILQSCQL